MYSYLAKVSNDSLNKRLPLFSCFFPSEELGREFKISWAAIKKLLELVHNRLRRVSRENDQSDAQKMREMEDNVEIDYISTGNTEFL